LFGFRKINAPLRGSSIFRGTILSRDELRLADSAAAAIRAASPASVSPNDGWDYQSVKKQYRRPKNQ
jgi:hypothetical protein